jgi:RNA polymerase sigma factor for flagellar operon FliA
VCQIHGQAIVRLRARLGDWRDGDAEPKKKMAARRQ